MPARMLLPAHWSHLATLVVHQVGSATPNFDRMAGNSLAKQIPWDSNPEFLAAWKEGRTGGACRWR